jgi:hypothetical protein
MTTSYARVRTDNAAEYVEQLAQNWIKSASSLVREHAHATVTLPFGCCELSAEKEFLDITVSADSIADTTLLEDIVSDRLDRLSHGERLSIAWMLLHEADRVAEGQNPRRRVVETTGH